MKAVTNNNSLIEFVQKNKTYLLLGLIAVIIFRNYLVMIITFLLLAFVGIFTIKISRMVPHISAETVTSSSILMGYAFGWQVGLAFGILVGFAGYIQASQMNITTIICALLMGLCGVLASMFHSMGYAFWIAFAIAYFIRANLSFFIISMINPNMMENVLHSYVESVYNVVIVMQFMQILLFIITLVS